MGASAAFFFGRRPTAVTIADSTSAQRVADLVTPALEGLGYDLVRVRFGGGAPVLQIMVERRDRSGMTVDHCAEASRTLSALLDVEDPISQAYSLEVSSPGIDRPLTRPGDFNRFAGFEARVELVDDVAGQRRFHGRLAGLDGETVRLQTDRGEAALPLAAVKSAKLLMTDALLAAAAKGAI